MTLERIEPGKVNSASLNPAEVERAFRSFLRTRSLKLTSLTLLQAFELMTEFWTGHKAVDVLLENGDGFVVYEDVTNHRRGTRLEIGFIRLLRVAPDASGATPWPAYRLRLRLCYKFDMDVVASVLPAGTWSFACWDAAEFDAFRQSVLDTPAFSTLRAKAPAEVNVVQDTVRPLPYLLKPEPGMRQMWWGVV